MPDALSDPHEKTKTRPGQKFTPERVYGENDWQVLPADRFYAG